MKCSKGVIDMQHRASYIICFDDDDIASIFQAIDGEPPEAEPPAEYMRQIAEELDSIFDHIEFTEKILY